MLGGELYTVRAIAHIHTDFPEKFGLPRQSMLVEELKGRVVFEPEYRNPEIVRGLEGFNYIWLLWVFGGRPGAGRAAADECAGSGGCSGLSQRSVEAEASSDKGCGRTWSATVRPPRLGGNKRMGVFATRSPFRPNPVGLSSVRLEAIEYTRLGPVLHVAGIDMKDNTAIIDIKPYLAYADCHTDAGEGFAGELKGRALEVAFPPELLSKLPEDKREAVIKVLSQDPRVAYQNNADRCYGLSYAGFDVRFKVSGNVLYVCEVVEQPVVG